MKVLLTGSAGFIGYHTTVQLLNCGVEVCGIDNLNDYYSVKLKQDRLEQAGIEVKLIRDKEEIQSKTFSKYKFIKGDICDKELLFKVFEKNEFDYVIHLAAQPGVRFSLQNPDAYIHSNITGFLNILEACRKYPVKHLVFASSSSVYGLNQSIPYSEINNVDHPISLYAATKKSNELMAHTYAHLFNISVTGLRFFTVYGPWGRPDMALFQFTEAILQGRPIQVYNHGEMKRDFTYVSDIVEGVIRIMKTPATADVEFGHKIPTPASSSAPYRIYNIGNSNPVSLIDFIYAIEDATNCKAKLEFKPLQAGDVVNTFADTNLLEGAVLYKPNTTIKEGVQNFVEWYLNYE